MRHAAPDLTSGRLLPVVATLLCFCSLSTQRGQQFYYTNFQQPPSPPQYEDFFQPRTSDPYNPYRHSPFPVSSSAPQSFSAFQQGSQLYPHRAPSFLDQITLNPGGFSRDQRLLHAYPSELNQPPSTPLPPHVYPSNSPTSLAYPSNPAASQDFPSEPDDLGFSTFVDQNLEFDDSPTEDPKSAPNPRQKDRTGDSVLRRKPGTRPQAGSRSNLLSPQRTRGQSTIENIKNAPREDHARLHPQYQSTSSPRTRGRFTPTTKAPVKVRQFYIRPSKVPFTPRRPLRPTSTSEAAEFDESRGLEDSNPPVELSAHQKYSSDPSGFEDSVQPVDSSEDFGSRKPSGSDILVVPGNSSEQSGSLVPTVSDDTSIGRSQEQVPHNSTLTADSHKVTTFLHDVQDTTDPVTGHKVTTDFDDVTATLHEEPTTVKKEEMPEQQHVRDIENNSSTFEVLTMNPRHTLVEEDNFRGFVDSILIDATDAPHVSTVSESIMTEDASSEVTLKELDGSYEPSTQKPLDISTVTVLNSKAPNSFTVSSRDSKLLGVSMVTTLDSRPLGVSVVTTKSVINGTMFAVPSVAPPILEQMATPVPAKVQPELTQPTESWVVVASVQTSRSVSGARFLPSSAVKQEERPKSLSGKTVPSSKPPHSTESIIDKYRVESELSSGILTWGFRPEGKKLQLKVLTDMTDTNTTTPISTTTYKSPVFIRKFSPNSGRTTPRPNKLATLFDTIPMDDLSRLLPSGFKQRISTNRRTTTPKHIDPLDYPQGDEPVKPNSTSSRSSGLSSAKNKIKVEDSSSIEKPPKKLEDFLSKIKFDDVSAFLPPGFKPQAMEPNTTTEKSSGVEDLLSKARPVDVSAFLPPGFKLTTEKPSTTTAKPKGVEGLLSKARPVDVSAFLPPGFKLTTEKSSSTTAKPSGVEGLLSKARPVDVSAFLPPGFKLTTEKSSSTTAKSRGLEGLLSKAQPVDVSAFLPPGFKFSSTTEKSAVEYLLGKEELEVVATLVPPGFAKENSTTTEATTPADVIRVKFPTRVGVTRKPLLPAHKPIQGPAVQKPKISTGWPTRATTEFTGWPTPSTTPIPLERLLEIAKTAVTSSSTTTSTTTTTTTSTTTTTTTPRPTTPGMCTEYCDLAGTVKLVGGVTWVPELLDHNTEEWQQLASEIQEQLETAYRKSDSLSRWFRKVRIDSFSDSTSVNAVGSEQEVSSVLVDYFVELADVGHHIDTQEIKQLFHSSLSADTESVISGRLQLGSFVVDPKFTDFIVLTKQVIPTVGYADEDVFLPQWAIAGIVIGLASLLFVIIFGVTVLVNRKKNKKKKSPTPLTEDMLNELNKNHMGGLDNYAADDLYNMDDVWNDKPPMKRSSGSLQENSMSNLYDSWRSEWNGYYYNAYYGNGNAGSSTSGYSRRRSDYDTNF